MHNIPPPVKRAPACFVTTLLLITLLPARAAAWGTEGHRIVATIAERNLSDAARQQVEEILADSGMCVNANVLGKMKCVANWADGSRFTTHTDTYNWHFVDIPLARAKYKPAVDCKLDTKKGKCGISGLDRARRILRVDIKDPNISRAQALMFIIHIVGDLHQPLHTVLEKTGGNFYFVTYEGADTNLHHVWDSELILTEMRNKSLKEAGYASVLGDEMDGVGLASFQQGSPIDWLLEAHGIANNNAYAGLPKVFKKTVALDGDYFTDNISVVNTQLERAGARLAKILNEDLH